MSLDSRFIIASDLQSLFRDKDTGLPLRNGVIYFWQDEARTIPKSVYKITGTPPNYSYVDLGAVINLTSVGTISDNGPNDIILYYFPYDGTPSTSTGTPQLYFVQVYSEGGNSTGVEQFTREGWPNFSATDTSSSTLNYVPNGQFLLHTDIPATDTTVAGQITSPITYVGQGGWTFERPNTSTAKDIVIFNTLPGADGFPRNEIQINTQSPNAGDTFKDLRLKFKDVNKFANTTQRYAFQAQSKTGSNLVVNIVLIKNFGTGGSTTTETVIGTLTITPSYTFLQIPIVFGDNSGKTIGPNNDDLLQIVIRLPTDIVLNAGFTDAIVTPDTGATINAFPTTTDAQFKYQSLAGWLPTPNPDGSDLYLPIKLTLQGMTFDHGVIGDVVSESNFKNYVNGVSTITNRLLGNGAQYETSAYSPLGIPYARLQAYYWNSTLNIPDYGTGPDYLNTYLSDLSPATQLRLATNSSGATTNIADGTAATGFTFATPHTGANYAITASRNGLASLIAISDFTGGVTSPNAGTSGFTVTDGINQTNRLHTFFVTTVVAAGLAGAYFEWSDPATLYYMWFTVDGVGADPAIPGATGIKVELLSTYSAAEVACFVLEAMSGSQLSTIVCNAASTLTGGDYFNFNTLTNAYYVWYKIAGVGTDPAPVGRLGIEVDLIGTETAAQVALATQIAMNSKYFAVPNFQGLFFRAFDPDEFYDIDAASRFGRVTSYYGNQIGLMQLDEFLLHFHEYTKVQGAGAIVQGGATFADSTAEDTTAVGGNETRGVNAVLNVAIQY